MSLFLGKIHYWLYNKILLSEKIEEEIIVWANNDGLPAEEWREHISNQYGAPTGGEDLEGIIDTSNIHGWLQQKIGGTELRQAALVTEILSEKQVYMNDLVEIYKNQGQLAARDYDNVPDSPEAMFNALHYCVLECMPCDRVNDVVSSNDDEIVWQTTSCIHKPYWQLVQGDVNNFYILRETWAKAFIHELNPTYNYEKANGRHIIQRR